MSRYEKKHGYVDVGIPLVLPILVKKTVLTDTKTGKESEGLDWHSYQKSDRKAWEKLGTQRD